MPCDVILIGRDSGTVVRQWISFPCGFEGWSGSISPRQLQGTGKFTAGHLLSIWEIFGVYFLNSHFGLPDKKHFKSCSQKNL